METHLANSTNRVNEFVPSPISDNSLLKWQFVSRSSEGIYFTTWNISAFQLKNILPESGTHGFCEETG